MPKLGECVFCYKPVDVMQETHDRFIAICEGSCAHYLNKPITGTTPEQVAERYALFVKELELGAEMWGAKIRDGAVED